jgi:DNA-binding NtrC family response regulator
LVSGKEKASLDKPENLDAFIKRWIRNNLSHGKSNLLADLTDHVARLIIVETLTACNGNQSQAAKRLGVSRPTLLYKLGKYGLHTAERGETDK